MNATEEKRRRLDTWATYLFWSWNLIFLAFMIFGFAPRLLPELLLSVQDGTTPAIYLVNAVILSAIPLAAIVTGLTVLRHAPARLFAMGYVVEGPLMMLLAVRFFLIRQATPALTVLLIIAGLGMAAFLWYVLDPRAAQRSRLAASLRLVGLTLMLLTSLYAALWILFYALPLIAAALRWLVETLLNLPGFFRGLNRTLVDMIAQGLAWLPFIVLGFILLFYTATLFVLAPIVVPWLSARAWWNSVKAQAYRYGWALPAVLVSLAFVSAAVLFAVSNRQPQQQAFALLAARPKTPAEAKTLLQKQETIRRGLLNSYLAPFRYMSADGEVRHVSDIYKDVFHLQQEQAFRVQRMYEGMVRPLIYKPVHAPVQVNRFNNSALRVEPLEAAQLYQQFFDQPIVDGERETIVQAVRSTWSADQATAAWQAVDDREVYLLRQEINLTEHGDWADIELYEVYQNQITDRQEVVYYFSLPESAVVTGVWLGNSPDRAERFVYQVAPRGAAQAVYRNETRRNRDPALVEQIGPRQYRLRVFPILPVQISWNENGARTSRKEGPPLYMWLTYRTMSEEGAWPLPLLADKRNVYWDTDTVRLVNGSPVEASDETWMPAPSVAASAPVTPKTHRFDLPGGETVLVRPASEVSMPPLPQDLRLAAVLDRSYSMSAHSAEIEGIFTRLREMAGGGASVDVYLTASPYRGEAPASVSLDELDLQNIVYFGGQNAAELLVQYEELKAGREYDTVIVLTDGSGYELGDSGLDVATPTAPLWLVHLGDQLPLGYDDKTLQAIQASGGGVAENLDEVFTRVAVSLASGVDPVEMYSGDIVDQYLWEILPTSEAELRGIAAGEEAAGFEAFAARRLILAEMHRARGSLENLANLDYLHEIARSYSLVTPYSSMIVLVNEQQEQLLEKLSEAEDRFDREHEQVGETTPSTQMPLTGVPEPHEWLLLGLVAAMLGYYALKQRSFQFVRD